MIWLLILFIIFWKPIYWFGMYIYNQFYTKDDIKRDGYLIDIKSWFNLLWALVKI